MKMFLEILFSVIFVIILGGFLLFLIFFPVKTVSPLSIQQNPLSSVCAGKNCFQVELAATEAERDQGLMYRAELDKNKGMLFIFDSEAIYPFWMKNTLISLDMVWMDSNGKVVFMAQNVQPCKTLICPSVFPKAKAKYVLEINAGICQEIGLKVGDTLKISIK